MYPLHGLTTLCCSITTHILRELPSYTYVLPVLHCVASVVRLIPGTERTFNVPLDGETLSLVMYAWNAGDNIATYMYGCR